MSSKTGGRGSRADGSCRPMRQRQRSQSHKQFSDSARRSHQQPLDLRTMNHDDQRRRKQTWVLTDCLAGRTPSTSATRLQSVFFQVREVGVRGTRVEICLRVIVGTLVFILDKQRDGCSEGYAVLQPGLEVDEVLFRSLKKGR